MALPDYSSRPTAAASDSGFSQRLSKMSRSFKSGKLRSQYFLGALVLILVLVGSAAAFFLAQNNADVRNQAAGTNNPYNGPCTSNAQCAPGYKCARDPGDNTMACMPSTTTAPTPSPSTNVGCGSAGQRVPAGVTLNCAR